MKYLYCARLLFSDDTPSRAEFARSTSESSVAKVALQKCNQFGVNTCVVSVSLPKMKEHITQRIFYKGEPRE